MSNLRNAMVLISGNGAGFVIRFVRNILIARLISVENYGIASTFLVATTLVTMATDLDFGKFILQNRRGNDQDFIAVVKSMQILRGVIVATIIFFIAHPMAQLFGHPELTWGYQIIALSPLIWSFQHPDLVRYARTMNFTPRIINNTASGLISLLLIWPLTLILKDFRVVLVLIIMEAIIQLILSFVQSERPYRVGWQLDVVRRALTFGWPLMASGLLLFAILQGDRIIVANQYGAAELGYFSAALNIVMPAVLAASGLLRTFFLPLLSRFQDNPDEFNHRGLFAIQSSLCATHLAVLGFAFAGPSVLVIVYGEAYRPAIAMVGLIGVAISFQLARAGTATVAMARGNTVNMLISNLVRIAFLPGALAIAVAGGSIPMMLLVGALGQFVAYGVSLILVYMRSRLGRPQAMCIPVLSGMASLTCLIVDLLTGTPGVASLSWLSLLATLFFLIQIAGSRVMLNELFRIVDTRLRRKK